MTFENNVRQRPGRVSVEHGPLMPMCVCVCVCKHTHVCVYTHTYVCMCVYIWQSGAKIVFVWNMVIDAQLCALDASRAEGLHGGKEAGGGGRGAGGVGFRGRGGGGREGGERGRERAGGEREREKEGVLRVSLLSMPFL